MRGKFIVFQGLDRSGKSTLSHRLQHSLSATHSTQWQTFPNRKSQIGQMINKYLSSSLNLSNEVIHLLFTANRWQAMQDLESKLSSGTTVICDRYLYSGVAYSVAKGLDQNWCCQPEQGLIEPDLIVYLCAEPEELAKREGFGEERYQRVEFQRKVYEVYEKLFRENGRVVRVGVKGKTLEELEGEVNSVVKARLFKEEEQV